MRPWEHFFVRVSRVMRLPDGFLLAPGRNTTDEACAADQEGASRWARGGTGVASVVETCLKTAADTYAWGTIALSSAIPAITIVGGNSATWNPGAIAAGAGASTTLAVTGALTTDFVLASHSGTRSNTFTLRFAAYVSAADIVTAMFYNPSAAAETVGSGTLSVKVVR